MNALPSVFWYVFRSIVIAYGDRALSGPTLAMC